MHLSVIFRILPLLVMGSARGVSADIGLSIKQVGRSGIIERDSVVAEDYEQCRSICGEQFGPEGQGLAAGSPLPNLVVTSSTTGTDSGSSADPTSTSQTKPTKSACRRKSRKHSKRPVTSTLTSSATGVIESNQPSLTSNSGAEASATSSTAEIVEPVQPSITSSSDAEASSTGLSSTAIQPPSASISSTAPEITQSPPSTGGVGGGVGGPDRSKPEDWLKAHNDERAKYGADPITWNEEMSSVAQAWGSQCKWEHSQGKYGENMAASIVADTDPVRTATGLWIRESKDYDYNNPTGLHWTQMVWKGLGEIGCAAVDCPADTAEDKKTIWTLMVCEYQLKPGATGGFAENVGRPIA